jgi:predicted nuclease of predicted toxin-antitoxin system
MKFLVDQPVSPLVAEWLKEVGHEAHHVRERALSRATDQDIFAAAVAAGAVIITADLDFSRILALSGRDQPGLILFRAGDLSDAQMLNLLRDVLERVPAEQLQCSVVVADRASLRIAPLPLRPDLAE